MKTCGLQTSCLKENERNSIVTDHRDLLNQKRSDCYISEIEFRQWSHTQNVCMCTYRMTTMNKCKHPLVKKYVRQPMSVKHRSLSKTKSSADRSWIQAKLSNYWLFGRFGKKTKTLKDIVSKKLVSNTTYGSIQQSEPWKPKSLYALYPRVVNNICKRVTN